MGGSVSLQSRRTLRTARVGSLEKRAVLKGSISAAPSVYWLSFSETGTFCFRLKRKKSLSFLAILVLKPLNVFQITENQDEIAWKPYKEGVEIYRLYGDGLSGPTTALIRYRAGGKVPLHEHIGYEHILILAGSQRDHTGVFKAGSFVVNSPGTRHAVVSDDGCIVLAIYEKPVRFLDNG
jgi:quercetin dioxygenase-like cupin family protein